MTSLNQYLFASNRESCQYLQHQPYTSNYGGFSVVLNVQGIGYDRAKRFLDKGIDTLAKMHVWANSRSSEHISGIGPVMILKIRNRLSAPSADNPNGTHPAFEYGLLPMLSSAELSEAARRNEEYMNIRLEQVQAQHQRESQALAQRQARAQVQTQAQQQARAQAQAQKQAKQRALKMAWNFEMLETIEDLKENEHINEQAYITLLNKLKELAV